MSDPTPLPSFSSFEELVGKTVSLSAPSKLNIRLKVEGRNKEGFHLLSMLNVLTDLSDQIELTFEELAGVRLTVDGPEAGDLVAATEKNLLYRAAKGFLELYSLPLGISLRLTKNIPSGAGLGGGSSDAGTTLRYFGLIFERILVEKKGIKKENLLPDLMKLSLSLGADVPFFLRGSVARVTGIGDRVERYDGRFLEGIRGALVLPKAKNDTKAVYDKFRELHPEIVSQRDMLGEQFGETLRLNTAVEGYDPFPSRTIRASLWRQLQGQLFNELEEAASVVSPIDKELLGVVRGVPDTFSGLTGSGSAIFVLPKTLDHFVKQGYGALEGALKGFIEKGEIAVVPISLKAST